VFTNTKPASPVSTGLPPRGPANDVRSQPQNANVSDGLADKASRARPNRLAIAEGSSGSVAPFPSPHQFFFARELSEPRLRLVSQGATRLRHGRPAGRPQEGYNPAWINGVLRSTTLRPGNGSACRSTLSSLPTQRREPSWLTPTRDRCPPLPGYKTMVTHFTSRSPGS
jgi:hypothetical protein